jgi:hypothetical protein
VSKNVVYRIMICTLLVAPLLLFSQASAKTVITQAQKIFAPDKPSTSPVGIEVGSDYFGWQIDASGNNALISSWNGVFAYTLVGNTWTFVQNLPLPDPPGFYKVSISGNVAAIGVNGAVNNPPKRPQVFIFNFTDGRWLLEQIIDTSIYPANLVVSGKTLLIANSDTSRGPFSRAGEVDLYQLAGATWTFKQQLAEDLNVGTIFGRFGSSIALNDNTIAVGAPSWGAGCLVDKQYVACVGAVFIYTLQNGTWSVTQIIRPDTSKMPFTGFGRAVALAGPSLLIEGEIHPLGDGSSSVEIYSVKNEK